MSIVYTVAQWFAIRRVTKLKTAAYNCLSTSVRGLA